MMTEQTSGHTRSAKVAWPAVTEFAEAARLRHLLQVEAGHPYQVIPTGQGFVVSRAGVSGNESSPQSVTRPTGSVEFASAGTGEIDIRFVGIRRPATVRNRIHERINRT